MTRLTVEEFRALPHEYEIVSDSTDQAIQVTRDSAASWTVEAKPNKLRNVPTEREEQKTVIAWADKHPMACVLYANVNGQYRQGQRPEPGLRSGIPDLFLPVGRGGYHGLYIEMKRTVGGVLSPEQRRWIMTLQDNGYCAIICRGADEAIAEIKAYLEEYR